MWSHVYAGRDFRSIAIALTEIRPLLDDLSCALDERPPMVDFDFRASGTRLDDVAVNCRLLCPRWKTPSVSGESLRRTSCAIWDFLLRWPLLRTVADILLRPALDDF